MPIEIEYLNEGATVVLRFNDVVTGNEIFAANREIYAEPSILKMRVQFVDWSRVTEIDFTPEEAESFATQDNAAFEKNPDFRIAIYTPSDHVFGLVRMWYGRLEGVDDKTGIFRDRDEALNWLGWKDAPIDNSD